MNEPTGPAGKIPACPTDRHQPDGTPHTIIGCGSHDVVWGGDGVYDCRECGIFFEPEAAAWVDVDTASSASRQHFIDTGRYLRAGEAEES